MQSAAEGTSASVECSHGSAAPSAPGTCASAPPKVDADFQCHNCDAECFVCRGDGRDEPLLSGICDCKDHAIHVRCQQQMMAQTSAHATCCAICQAEYKNVTFETKLVSSGAAGDAARIIWADSPWFPFVIVCYALGAAGGCTVCMVLLPVMAGMQALTLWSAMRPRLQQSAVVHLCRVQATTKDDAPSDSKDWSATAMEVAATARKAAYAHLGFLYECLAVFYSHLAWRMRYCIDLVEWRRE